MRVLIIGGSGTIGSKAAAAFEELGDEVITVGRSTEVSVDLEDLSSITEMFNKVGRVDAVVTTDGIGPVCFHRGCHSGRFPGGNQQQDACSTQCRGLLPSVPQ
ncbi:NAD-dependent epimerase/dehydratase family protein [Cutibacterium avidum]|uniref:NAD-dependent epimerase/dehydratase family protein n=1 Tax=Cutibacterium avidum TaxID=33010 RepID=UPI00211BB3F2|nr:NAD-dependent epimerase/dehydratase family protein [Cutibacterium avidum]